jgi:imidazolonepropionase
MNADLLVRNIGELWSQDAVPPVKGAAMDRATVRRNAFLAVRDGLIADVGSGSGDAWEGPETMVVDARGGLVTPGFVDGHTHLVHAGSREEEFGLRLAGVGYLDILGRGGGIHATVAKTRAASAEDLFRQALTALDDLLLSGVTTLEAKSGYGLDTETELRQLEVARRLADAHPVEIHSTYLGAHALPKEYASDREGYLSKIVGDLDVIADRHLAEGVDVFCEAGVFTVDEARRILTRAKECGFTVRIHADEIVGTGGAGLAVDLGCASADHLGAVSDRDILALAGSDVVANLLPGTSFFLGQDFAPARRLIDAGCAVAVASDYNPGSSPSDNFQFTMQLAAIRLKMTPSEVLTATTANAAFHLGVAGRVGSLAVGKDADFVLFDANRLAYVLHRFATNRVKDVYKKGRRVVADGRIVRGG